MNRLSHSNGKIDVWFFPKGIFPSGNLARVFSKVATFQQIPNLKLPKFILIANLFPQHVLDAALGPQHILATALSPYCSLRRLRKPNLIFGKLPLGKLSLANHTWNNALGKIPNTSRSLGRVFNPPPLNQTEITQLGQG